MAISATRTSTSSAKKTTSTAAAQKVEKKAKKTETTKKKREPKPPVDTFEPSPKTSASTSRPTPSPRVEPTEGLVNLGSAKLKKDRETLGSALATAAQALIELTANVASDVLRGQVTAATAPLFELVSAFFTEFTEVTSGKTLAPPSEERWPARFERSFGMTLGDAAGRFLDFLLETDRAPAKRLAWSTYERGLTAQAA